MWNHSPGQESWALCTVAEIRSLWQSTSHSPPQHSVHIYSSKKRPTIPILPGGVVGKLNSNFPLQNVLTVGILSSVPRTFCQDCIFHWYPWGFEIVGFERQLHIMIKFQLYDCAKMLTLLKRFFWNATHYSVQVTSILNSMNNIHVIANYRLHVG